MLPSRSLQGRRDARRCSAKALAPKVIPTRGRRIWSAQRRLQNPSVPDLQVAREALSELELPHLYRAVARGSPRRQELYKKRGLFQAPYLEARSSSGAAGIRGPIKGPLEQNGSPSFIAVATYTTTQPTTI